MAGPLGWRAAFLLEAAAMAPFVAFCALAPPIALRGMSKGGVSSQPLCLQYMLHPFSYCLVLSQCCLQCNMQRLG